MPSRKSKGPKRKARREPTKRELVYKDDGQEYAVVTKMLGNGRCELQCLDGVQRLGNIRGKLKHKVWIKLSDHVLVGLREFQDKKCDILHKYTQEEVRNLRCYGEIGDIDEVEEEEDKTFDFDDI
jgi:translation initiation factor 1A